MPSSELKVSNDDVRHLVREIKEAGYRPQLTKNGVIKIYDNQGQVIRSPQGMPLLLHTSPSDHRWRNKVRMDLRRSGIVLGQTQTRTPRDIQSAPVTSSLNRQDTVADLFRLLLQERDLADCAERIHRQHPSVSVQRATERIEGLVRGERQSDFTLDWLEDFLNKETTMAVVTDLHCNFEGCEYTGKDLRALKAHQRAAHTKKQCPVCHKYFGAFSIAQHMKYCSLTKIQGQPTVVAATDKKSTDKQPMSRSERGRLGAAARWGKKPEVVQGAKATDTTVGPEPFAPSAAPVVTTINEDIMAVMWLEGYIAAHGDRHPALVADFFKRIISPEA